MAAQCCTSRLVKRLGWVSFFSGKNNEKTRLRFYKSYSIKIDIWLHFCRTALLVHTFSYFIIMMFHLNVGDDNDDV